MELTHFISRKALIYIIILIIIIISIRIIYLAISTDNIYNIDNIDNIDNSKHLNAYNVDNETIDALEHNTILDIMDDKQIQTEDDSFTVYTRKKNSKRTPKSLEFLSGKLIDDDTTMN